MDPIADMLTRIRNAQAVRKETVKIPFSRLLFQIAKIMEEKGYIAAAEKKGRGIKRTIAITLKYKNGYGAISGIKRLSKPSRRIYAKSSDLKSIVPKPGTLILSTPKGIMTDSEARKNKLGGEVLLEIW